MVHYVVLLRGINVGGRNAVPMVQLRAMLEAMGCTSVATYIQSGNVTLRSELTARALGKQIEQKLRETFALDSDLIKVLAFDRAYLERVVAERPKGFGDQPEVYHSDVIFMLELRTEEAWTAFSPLEGVDKIWAGEGVIYSQRLSEKRTKSRLNRMMASPLYLSMTIRTWATTLRLLEMVRAD